MLHDPRGIEIVYKVASAVVSRVKILVYVDDLIYEGTTLRVGVAYCAKAIPKRYEDHLGFWPCGVHLFDELNIRVVIIGVGDIVVSIIVIRPKDY